MLRLSSTSHSTLAACPPAASISVARPPAALASMSTTATLAPRLASVLHRGAHRAPAAPVTTATLPEKSYSASNAVLSMIPSSLGKWLEVAYEVPLEIGGVELLVSP